MVQETALPLVTRPLKNSSLLGNNALCIDVITDAKENNVVAYLSPYSCTFHIYYFRNGIEKIKLQHEVGNPSLITTCDYKHPELCQHPILHDMEITSSVASGILSTDSNDYMTNRENIARKNLAKTHSATIKAYKDRSNSQNIGGSHRVRTLLAQ